MGTFTDSTVYNMRTDYIAGMSLAAIGTKYGISVTDVKASLLALISGGVYMVPPALYAALSPV